MPVKKVNAMTNSAPPVGSAQIVSRTRAGRAGSLGSLRQPGYRMTPSGLKPAARIRLNLPRFPDHRAALSIVVAAVGSFAVWPAGCTAPETRRLPLAPLPLQDAAAIVSDNASLVRSTLRATGSVDISATATDGVTRRYSLDGTLFYLPSKNLRFTLKSLAGTEFACGSNDVSYWIHSLRGEEHYYRRPHGSQDVELLDELPIRPDQLIEALGLTPIPTGLQQAIVQRVVDEYQQLLFIDHDVDGLARIAKEYWLDRYEPRLVRRVIFRDHIGNPVMESRLDGYRAFGDRGLLLPNTIEIRWPKTRSSLVFRVGRWRTFEDIGSDAVQFVPPDELGLVAAGVITDVEN